MKTKTLLFLCAFLVTTLAFGTTYTVTNTAESGEGSLAWAYESATAAEDIIAFNVDATEFTIATIMNKSLTIDGLNQFNSQKIIFKKPVANKFLEIVGKTLTLKNLIFEGESTPGNIGLIADLTSTLNIENCILRNINSSAAANNGGACRIQGVLNIKKSLFENNTSGTGAYGGGAICIYNSANVTIENTSFVGNKAVAGGAIAAIATVATGFSLTVSNCTFSNNIADQSTGVDKRGGAVYLKGTTASESNATFINCTFIGNSAANNGGGLCAFASASKKININLINSILLYNMSGGNKYSDIDVWNINDRVYFTTASNCIYGYLFGTGVETGIVWTNSIKPADITLANIFFQKETWMTTFERPVIAKVGEQKVAVLTTGSIADNAGVASLAGYSIPSVDQVGKSRPATPAIGALEYDPALLITVSNRAINTNNIQLNIQGKQLSFRGLNGETEMLVYGLTGNLLHKSLVKDGVAVALDHLQSNFVIVKVQNQSFKVLLK